jgi:Flp pilus assembly protein TadB
MTIEPGKRRDRAPYAVIAVVTGAVFGVVALLNAPGITYAVVAVLAGMGYALVGVISRRRRE